MTNSNRRGRAMKQAQRGLSLIELVISIIIVAMLIFSVFQLITSGTRYQIHTKNAAKASALSQRILEDRRLFLINYSGPGAPIPDESWTSFPAPDDAFRYRVDYYNYQRMYFPYTTPHPPYAIGEGQDPDKTMYIVAVKVTVEGPLRNGSPLVGYRSISAVSLVTASRYQGDTPIASADMPSSIHPPPPTPMLNIALPPSP
jgi:prepilin-type N-terminal cleavage/methylation domain-containing protein